jgi:hypothetical protein
MGYHTYLQGKSLREDVRFLLPNVIISVNSMLVKLIVLMNLISETY